MTVTAELPSEEVELRVLPLYDSRRGLLCLWLRWCRLDFHWRHTSGMSLELIDDTCSCCDPSRISHGFDSGGLVASCTSSKNLVAT